jgi:hypothetical protein
MFYLPCAFICWWCCNLLTSNQDLWLRLEKIRFFGVKWWFFTRNTPKNFAPPSAQCNFFKCTPPLTWNPGSAPGSDIKCIVILAVQNRTFYPKVCIMQLLKVAWYRVIALFTLYFLVDDTSIMIFALPCNRGLRVHHFVFTEIIYNLWKNTCYLVPLFRKFVKFNLFKNLTTHLCIVKTDFNTKVILQNFDKQEKFIKIDTDLQM